MAWLCEFMEGPSTSCQSSQIVVAPFSIMYPQLGWVVCVARSYARSGRLFCDNSGSRYLVPRMPVLRCVFLEYTMSELRLFCTLSRSAAGVMPKNSGKVLAVWVPLAYECESA